MYCANEFSVGEGLKRGIESGLAHARDCSTILFVTSAVTRTYCEMDSSPMDQPVNKSSAPSDGCYLVQRYLLATPLYFYYHHLIPPGYFSRLLRVLAQLRQQQHPLNDDDCAIPLNERYGKSFQVKSNRSWNPFSL